MILSCHDISKSFGENTLFSHCSFHIEEHEKAAVIGDNGCGKTTLFRIILSLEPADGGQCTFAKDKTIGYLAQHQDDMDAQNTIFDELLTTKEPMIRMEQTLRELEAQMHGMRDTAQLKPLMERYETLTHRFGLENGYSYRSEITGVLKGLGFAESDFSKQISTLSGGQKTRVALGKILLQSPDILFLDEPTNHLDMDSIRWLENYLHGYKGAALLISHDRYFLDRVISKVIEIEAGRVTVFPGNYSEYAVRKEAQRSDELHAYLNQQREIRHQEEVIEKLRSFNREKSIKRAESREKTLAKMEMLDKPVTETKPIRFSLVPSHCSGQDVLAVEALQKSYGPLRLFSGLSMDIRRGEHVALIGKNGTGKTTLLKLINNLEAPDKGEIRLGANVEIGYYDQEHHVLHMEKTIFDEISDDYPELTNTQIRNTLAAFLFTGDDVFKKISSLSGGERGRVSLARLMLSSANFLILDEPTNHLDIASKEILEQALNSYEGTVLYVSHDRYFINRTAHRILDLENERLSSYLGNYDYYLEKHGDIYKDIAVSDQKEATEPGEETAGKKDWQEQKEALARRRKAENELQKCEKEIADTEEKLDALEREMARPETATNIGKLAPLSKESEALKERLDALYENWEALSLELERL